MSAAELATPSARGRASLLPGEAPTAPRTGTLGGTPATEVLGRGAASSGKQPRGGAKVDLGEGFFLPAEDLERLERRQAEKEAAEDPAARAELERRRHLSHVGKTYDYVMSLFDTAPAVRPLDDVVDYIERQFSWKNPISRDDAARRLELLVESAGRVVGDWVALEEERASGRRMVRVNRARAYEHEVRRRLVEAADKR